MFVHHAPSEENQFRTILGKRTLSVSAFFTTVFVLVAVAASYLRLYLGIDFTDEALYTAIPYRFALGDQPFIDEWNLTQNSSLLVYPFVKAFLLLTGSSDAIILYTRHLVFLFSLTLALLVFTLLKTAVGRNTAALIALLPLVFVPYNLLGPSYNAVGSGFFAMGLFLGWDPARRKKNGVWAVAAGFSHGFAAFAYPTLALPALCAFTFVVLTSESRIKEGLRYGAGALGAVLLVFLCYRLNPVDILNAVNYVLAEGKTSQHGWNFEKAAIVLRDLWTHCFYKPGLFALLFAIALGIKKKKTLLTGFLILLWPAALFFSTRAVLGGQGVQGVVIYNSLVAPFLFALLPRSPVRWNLLLGIWLPSAAAGAVMAWSSNMGTEAAAVGLVPATAVTLIFLADLIPQKRLYSVGKLLPAALILIVVLYSRLNVYLDGKPKTLTTRVAEGPFQGLFTTPQKGAYLRDLSEDVARARGDAKSILFMPHFPAGYLMTDLKPATLTVWGLCPATSTPKCTQYYSKRAEHGALIVKFRRLFYYGLRTDEYLHLYPMEALTLKNHRLVVARNGYEIYETLPPETAP